MSQSETVKKVNAVPLPPQAPTIAILDCDEESKTASIILKENSCRSYLHGKMSVGVDLQSVICPEFEVSEDTESCLSYFILIMDTIVIDNQPRTELVPQITTVHLCFH